MAQNIGIPKGTRDFIPQETARRNYIFNTLKEVFRKYAFAEIETPAMENLSTLLGKYGEEGDKLLFRILNSGDFLRKAKDEHLGSKDSFALAGSISEKGLRYDLTVPFARFVVQHRNELTFPFKRFQMQPVWRADRPQRGRYREFYQCDVDVIGSNSLINELELIQIIDEAFRKLRLKTQIKINNRKILSGIAEVIGHQDKLIDITVAIDKLDKMGLEAVVVELMSKGLDNTAIDKLIPFLNLKGTNSDKISQLKNALHSSDVGLSGVSEIEKLFQYLETIHIESDVELDLSLARGLNYYTGAIFEVKSLEAEMGSICGGGRYDDLTGIFGLKNVSGVGVSFGADRIYDVLTQLDRFPDELEEQVQVLIVNFGSEEELHSLKVLSEIRKNGIKAELYPDKVKMKKQLSYANAKKIPFVILIGEEEMKSDLLTIKDMNSGEQEKLSVSQIIEKICSC